MKQSTLVQLLPLLLLPLLVAFDCGDSPRESLSAEANAQRQPVWSPDGARIAFNYGEHIYVVKSDGSRLQLISDPPPDDAWYADVSPSISPDGSRVAFATFRHESGGMVFGRLFGGTRNFEIVTSALDGSDYRRRTDHKAWDTNPVWSPDGTRIAFVSYRVIDEDSSYDSFPEICTMAADGSDVQIVTPSSLRTTMDPPLWSPDGRRIAFLTYDGDLWDDERARVLYTVAADGSDLRKIDVTTARPAWSLDGSRIAFEVTRKSPYGIWIYTARPDGSDLQQVPMSERLGYTAQLSWSLDSSEIWHVGSRYIPQEDIIVQGIHAIKVDGSGVRTIARIADLGANPMVGWSPDRSRIAFRDNFPSPSSPHVVLYTLAADGSDKRVLAWAEAWTEDRRLVTENTAGGGP